MDTEYWDECKALLDAYQPESEKTRLEKLENLIEIQKAARAVEPFIAELQEIIRDFQEREAFILHKNSRMVTKILNELRNEFGNGVYQIIQKNCPNLTCCKDCHIDDFCHMEGCELA